MLNKIPYLEKTGYPAFLVNGGRCRTDGLDMLSATLDQNVEQAAAKLAVLHLVGNNRLY